jgi:hypothetical protein
MVFGMYAPEAWIDAPGAVHHIVMRGIEPKGISRDGKEREIYHSLGRLEPETTQH